MTDYFVEAKSRRELRKCAELVRKTFHLEDVVYFPIVQLLDVLGEIFENFSYFQTQAEQKFACYIEVPNNYRASQYDHTSDSYIKKELSQRMYSLSDGTAVQRDWYSSYLLYSIDTVNMTIDKSKCITGFSDKYAKERAMISWIIKNKIRVLNSGIRF